MKRSTFLALLRAIGFKATANDADEEVPPGQKLLPGAHVLMWGTADGSGDAQYPVPVGEVVRAAAADDAGNPQPVFETQNWIATMDPGSHWMVLGSFGIPAAGQA